MKKEHLTIEAHRSGYSVNQCGGTLSVGELIDYLSQWDDDTPVYISNDNGYTYGSISFDDIDSHGVDDEEEVE